MSDIQKCARCKQRYPISDYLISKRTKKPFKLCEPCRKANKKDLSQRWDRKKKAERMAAMRPPYSGAPWEASGMGHTTEGYYEQ